jgi:hypothetical protein
LIWVGIVGEDESCLKADATAFAVSRKKSDSRLPQQKFVEREGQVRRSRGSVHGPPLASSQRYQTLESVSVQRRRLYFRCGSTLSKNFMFLGVSVYRVPFSKLCRVAAWQRPSMLQCRH